VFSAVKEIKATSASNNVIDNFAFLEFLATNASRSPSSKHSQPGQQESPHRVQESSPLLYSQTPAGTSSGQNSYTQGAHLTAPGALEGAHTQGAQAGRKQLRRQNEPAGGQLPSMQAIPPSAQASNNPQQSKSAQKSAIPHRQPVLQPLQGAAANSNLTASGNVGGGKNPYSSEIDTSSSMIKSSSQGANQRR